MEIQNQTQSNTRVQTLSFLVIIALMGILVLVMLRPLANILFFSAILAIVFRPLYVYFNRYIKSTAISSCITVLVVFLGLSLFVYVFGQLLYNELNDVFHRFKSGEFVFDVESLISGLPVSLQSPITTLTQDLSSLVTKFTAGAFQTFSAIVSNLAAFFFNLFLVFFSFFYLLKDGSKITHLILAVSPISNHQEQVLYQKVVTAVNGVMKGTFLVALVQSFVALIGFALFGVPNPFLWTMATFVAAFVPNIGTSLVIIPAVLYLLITGHPQAGVGFAIWGAVAVGLIDNVISPKLVGSNAKLHPLLVLLSVIGGLKFFGALGFLLGPIFMAIFSALVEMYISNFREYLE